MSVADRTPPQIQAVTASKTVLWPPNQEMTQITVSATATDSVTPSPACRITSVSSNEAGSGQWQITGPLTVSLAADRNGSGSGRVYTIIVSCTDAAGNSSSGAATVVVVPHNQEDH